MLHTIVLVPMWTQVQRGAEGGANEHERERPASTVETCNVQVSYIYGHLVALNKSAESREHSSPRTLSLDETPILPEVKLHPKGISEGA